MKLGRKRFLQNAATAEAVTSLYLHVPFCRTRCWYCDFCSNELAGGHADRTVAAMLAELAARQDVLARPLATLFVGGGTPTALPPALLERLLAGVAPWLSPATEATVEANPNSASPKVLGMLRRAGVNRLSLGVQSFQPDELAALGRRHSPRDARDAVAAARAAGFANISLDLIYGIPGQTLDTWRRSLDDALSLAPEHLSAYCLSYPPGTRLADALARGEVRPMDEDLQRACYEDALDRLAAGGLEPYEISNFARPGRRCRHNLTYWHNEAYLGIGPSAVSYVGGRRQTNHADLAAYAGAVEAGRPAVAYEEHVTGRLLQAETLMLALRLREGVDRAAFARRFGVDPVEAFAEPIRRHQAIGMLDVTAARVRLTRPALFVSDGVLADIVAAAAE